MVEAVLAGSASDLSDALQSCAGKASSVARSVVIPMFNEAHGLNQLFARLDDSLALAPGT